MERSLKWDYLRSPELKQLSEENAVVLMPVGAIEQHGPHLPVATDLIVAEWVSEITAKKLRDKGIPAVIAPSFIIANSMHHMNFPGSLSIEPRTFIQVLREQCAAIASQGFRRIVLMNGHGGNTAPINTALIEINRSLGFHVYHMSCLADVDESQYLDTQKSMYHSGEVETSIILAYDETLVDPSYKTLSGPIESGTEYEDSGAMSTFRRMEEHTPNGIMGNAYAATKEKGLALVNAYGERITQILSDEKIWKN